MCDRLRPLHRPAHRRSLHLSHHRHHLYERHRHRPPRSPSLTTTHGLHRGSNPTSVAPPAEAFEPLYRRVNTYLDVEDRVGILNNKLDIVNDLLESLGNQLEIRNAHRLEWIIIILIMIEIGLDLLKEIEMGPVGLVTGLLRRVVLRRAA